MSERPEFDVFLAHNSQDKPQVKAIAAQLERRGLKVWIDDEQILPGRPFQDVIQQAISNVKSAAIFIGPQGLGRWEVLEMRTFISQFVNTGLPVIPILLPGVGELPQNLLFLRQFNWVSFASGINNVGSLEKLVWGITQQQPQTSSQICEHFDVFLCHNENEKDLSEVEQIAKQLEERGITSWLEKNKVPPGRFLEDVLADQIAQIHSVAIFIGSEPCPWQENTMEFFIGKFIELKRPVILVILPSALQKPELPINLQRRNRVVDFRPDKAEAFYDLVWGITGIKPETSPKTLEENNSLVREVNYARLEELLEVGKWQEADRETKKILLESSGKKPNEKLGVDDIRNFSCETLCTIDELWVKYSNGRFGFSVQNKIWHQMREKPFWQKMKTKWLGNSDNNENEKDFWYIFGERVGWCHELNKGEKRWVQYKDMTFNMNALQGHLPCCREWWKQSYPKHDPKRFCALMLRIEKCQEYQL
jgi:hypothetical protein